MLAGSPSVAKMVAAEFDASKVQRAVAPHPGSKTRLPFKRDCLASYTVASAGGVPREVGL